MTSQAMATNDKAAVPEQQVEAVREACAFIDDSEGERVTLAHLADHVGLSPWHLQRVFKRVIGLSPRDYADARRSERFRSELKGGESVAGATYGAGYGSASRVYERAQHDLGMTPASYARGGKGARIAFAIVDSPLGRLLVAATGKGICFLCVGDDDGALEAAVREEFPQAESLQRDDAALGPAIDAVVAYLEGEVPHIDLPLDVRATAFQRRVWNELGAIPYGETRTYSEIARALGVPKGQRAVGRACATNPVSLLIPCHRALREDGSLGGYRWGLSRKRALLRHEAERTRA